MAHALLSALPIRKRIDCFVRALGALGESNSEEQEMYANIARDCHLNDFLSDIASYYHGRFKVEDKRIQSRTLCELSQHSKLGRFIDECLGNKSLALTAKKEWGSLVAVLRCCATSLDHQPWWNPLSRKHSVCKAMKEAVAYLEVKWRNLFDEKEVEGIKKEIQKEAKKYIKGRKKTWI